MAHGQRDARRPSILSLADPRAARPELTGQKGAVLARLKAHSFPVPDGFIITTAATEVSLRNAQSISDIREVLPKTLRGRLQAEAKRLQGFKLAVRSSAIAEDLQEASYAGQYDTVLGVEGAEALEEAVATCLASYHSPRAKAYRSRVGNDRTSGEDGLAVIVQHLVPADFAGVAFSADPVTGDRDVARVSAVRGLGDRLMQGDTDAEEWIVPDDPAQKRETPNPPWPTTKPYDVSGPPRRLHAINPPVLSAATAQRIATTAGKVEDLMGCPQDVEWALAADKLWLLQARPIGMLPIPPDGAVLAGFAWWRDDHDLEPLSTFGADLQIPHENQAFNRMFQQFGVLRERSSYVAVGGLIFGRRVPPDGFPPISNNPKYSDQLATCPPVLERLPIATRALEDDVAGRLTERWHAECRPALEAGARGLLRVGLTELDDVGLCRHLDKAIDLYAQGVNWHFLLWMSYSLALYELDLACCELLGWRPGVSIRLLTGSSDATSESTKALAGIAALLVAQRSGGEELGDAGASLESLRRVSPAIQVAIDGFLERFGARPTSNDPASVTLKERPDLLVSMLRGLVGRVDPSADQPISGINTNDVELLESLTGHSEKKVDQFRRALTAARKAYPTRDSSDLWGIEIPAGVVRFAVLEVGRRLETRGVLQRREDVFHLKVDEVKQVLLDQTVDCQAVIKRRRAERAWVLTHPAPFEIGEFPPLPYRTDCLPEPLRHIHNAIEWPWSAITPQVEESPDPERILSGIPGSPGTHTGRVRLVTGTDDLTRVSPGDVLVCQSTLPSWAPVFGVVGGLVTDIGDLLSHPAILAQEHGIPAVLATRTATSRLTEGLFVTVDGSRGFVVIEP